MRVGLLTGGGDAPGLNGVIESVGTALLQKGHEVIGIIDGFEGIYNQNVISLNLQRLQGIHAEAGTLLGTSNKIGTRGREKEFLEKYKKLKLDGLIACGGDGTFSGLKDFKNEIPLIGVPKTIDNDLAGTDVTFGFDTACTVVAESIEALRSTAEAHRRIMVVETMGRNAGWIALGGGLASYADIILIPERPYDSVKLLDFIQRKKASGRRGLLIAVSEAAYPIGGEALVAFEVKDSPEKNRLGGIAEALARFLDREANWESRHVVLGHLQRSRLPTVTDRFLTLSMGVEVSQMVIERDWGKGVAYRNGSIVRVPINDFMGSVRCIEKNHRWIQLAQSLGIFI